MATIPLTLADVAYDIQINQLPNWIRAVEDHTMRQGFLYPRLAQQGGIMREPGAYEDIWKIKVRLPEVRPMVNHQGLSFQPTQTEIQCRVGLRAMETTEAMSLMDQWINSGPNALRKLVNDKGTDLRKAMEKAFNQDVWLSGESTGRTDRYHGIETGLAEGTCVVADKIAAPSGSYANQSTVLQTNGGYWSADLGTPNNASLAVDWPDGKGDNSYDATSPILVNTGSTSWGTGSNSHKVNLFRAISQAQVWLSQLRGQDGAPDLCACDSWSFQGLRESQEAKTRLVHEFPSTIDVGLPGYKGSVNLDGLTIYPDFYCPVSTCYMLATSKIGVKTALPDGQLFASRGPIEIPQLAFSSVWALFTYGNFRYKSMAHFAKLYPYATS
jgi:hypothetical protein